MPIAVTCQCGKKYNVQDSHAGKKIRCKECGESVAIPAAVQEDDEFGALMSADESDQPEAPRRPRVKPAKAKAKPAKKSTRTAGTPSLLKRFMGCVLMFFGAALVVWIVYSLIFRFNEIKVSRVVLPVLFASGLLGMGYRWFSGEGDE